MEKSCWNAVEKHYKLLYTHIDVAELVSYLKVPLARYAADLDKISTSSIHPHEHHRAQDLLSYLKHVPNSFQLFCEALVQCRQGFLSKSLQEAVRDTVETDSPTDIKIPACRKSIFDSVIQLLFEGHHRINIHGLRGVGTSWFTKQILQHLREEYYFKIFAINAISTPLPLQKEHFKQYLEEISVLQSYEKKFSIIWLDNIDTDKVRQDSQKYHEYQKKVFDELVGACQKKEISCIFTSRKVYPVDAGTDMINYELHCLDDPKDLKQIIKTQFPHFTPTQRKVILRLGQTNPLDILLASSLYCLCDMDTDSFLCCYSPDLLDYSYNDQAHTSFDSRTFRKLIIDADKDNVSTFSLNGIEPTTSADIIKVIFSKLSKEMRNIIIIMCSVRCECKVTETLISYIISQDQPTVRFCDKTVKDTITELSRYRLLDLKNDVISINSNLYFLFREHFSTLCDISNKRYLYYIRYCNYYLDYVVDVLNIIECSSLSKEDEWQDNICTIAAILNPPNCEIEKDIMERKLYKEHAKVLFEKRVLVVNRLQKVDLNFPDNELIFSIDFLLNKCESLSYGKAMDRFTLLCNLTKLFINSPNTYNIDNASYAAKEAIKESERLKKANKSLKNHLYLELLYNILEIQWKDNKHVKAKTTLETIAKLLKSSMFKNQRGMRRTINLRLAELNILLHSDTMSRNKSLVQALETSEDGSDSMTNFIHKNMFFGDLYYNDGDLAKAFKYYFAMFQTIDEPHKYLEVQETVCWTLGHLSLQKSGQLSVKELDEAIRFYEQAQVLYVRRKRKKKHYITLFIGTACLLRGSKERAKELLYSIVRTNETFKFFFALINKDTEHVPSWSNLTLMERKHTSNTATSLPVNFAMLEEDHYNSKYQSLAKENDPLFIEWPSDNLNQAIDSFNCDDVQSWTEKRKRLVVYSTITSTAIEEPNPEVTFTPKLARKNVAFSRPRTYTM